MDRILLINEILLSLPNQSLSIEYQQLSCIHNMKIWLIIHFIITRFIDTYLFMCILVLFDVIVMLISYRYWRRIKNFSGNQLVGDIWYRSIFINDYCIEKINEIDIHLCIYRFCLHMVTIIENQLYSNIC